MDTEYTLIFATPVFVLFVLFFPRSFIVNILSVLPFYLLLLWFRTLSDDISSIWRFITPMTYKITRNLFPAIFSCFAIIVRQLYYKNEPNTIRNQVKYVFINICYSFFPLLLFSAGVPLFREVSMYSHWFDYISRAGFIMFLIAFFHFIYLIGKALFAKENSNNSKGP